ncbi:MAG: phenylacetic acid degradation operon negative regulatory protein [Parcubacteria group bacterium Gr01-1014_24]|nr:MAG: phenylacetic acid degradation operon negative regulatory protein [Parcubacteria group bacterium Gr01-1014_24]
MRSIEQEVRKREKRAKLQRAILSTIFALGGLSVALIAPKMTKVLAQFEPDFMKSKYRKYSFNRSLARLKNAGFIVFEKTERGNFARLTLRGQDKLRQLRFNGFQIKKPKRWDGKWRLLMFDVKEKRKNIRDRIRRNLFKMEFLRLQDSVWVYPYDCEDFITLMKADFRVGRDVLYVVADKIENDNFLIKHFKLAHY